MDECCLAFWMSPKVTDFQYFEDDHSQTYDAGVFIRSSIAKSATVTRLVFPSSGSQITVRTVHEERWRSSINRSIFRII